MSREADRGPEPLTTIQIDLKERALSFVAESGSVTRLTFSPAGIVYELLQDPQGVRTAGSRVRGESAPDSPGENEREPTVTLTGRLKSKPREGRPDGRGLPTAWARLAVHEEGRSDAHLYSATFHRHTARIALSLDRDAPITIQGYPHPSDDLNGKRLDTFSVINIVHYPGKEERPR